MNLAPIAVEQRVDLQSGEVASYLVLIMPNGRETRAPVDDDTFKHFVHAYLGGKESVPETVPASDELEAGDTSDDGDGAVIDWTRLPDDVLDQRMKTVLRALNVSSIISRKRLAAVIDQVTEQFDSQDWEEVGLHMKQVDPPEVLPPPSPVASAPAPVPEIGKVTWADGKPIAPAAAPAKTVPMDAKGYPVLQQQGVVDPTTISTGAVSDEDGIGQV